MVLLFLLAAGGCSWGNETTESTSTPIDTDTVAPQEALSGQPQGATLRMASGHSVARFKITALDPPTHVFDVRIVAPTSANLVVRMRTAPPPGRLLRIFDPTQTEDFCKVRRRTSVCSLPFPQLEAQREGPWTVIVNKRSDPAATVRVDVTFRSP